MQLRHLRYFVKIVDAGSISRAATVIHVAQPALSQQIAELEEELGVTVLQRNPRGVRPTPAGEILYREATAILRQIEQLPAVVRSTDHEIQGSVSLGMSSTLASSVSGPFIQACRSIHPKVSVRLSAADSEILKARVIAQSLDVAVVFEDELVASLARQPIFRQRLYFISREPVTDADTISLSEIAGLPLVLPSQPNVVRSVLDQAFAAAGLTPNVVTEGDQLASMASSVQHGIGGTILPRGDHSPDGLFGQLSEPLLVEPPLYLTASIVWSPEFPLSRAGEAVRIMLAKHLHDYLLEDNHPGVERIER